MPISKRPSSASDNTDQDGESILESQQQVLPRARKRIRHSIERDSTNDFNEEITDEEYEVTQLQHLATEARQRAKKPAQGAENGVIQSITCTNFMCHAHLHVELGPLINFVIGHNGSGKSAVLTALTICLGGKASSTNRGSTLKSFIKEGQESSTLSVKIKNNDGYQYEIYGESILVERSFNRSGSSGFKVKSVNGRVVSTTKATVDEILDYYALQLDNPICILSQDMARQFLQNSSATEKYRFFIKGVQLEQMNHDYDLLSENIEDMESTFANKLLNGDILSKAEKDASIRLNRLQKLEQTSRKIEEYSAQMAWAQVEDQELSLRQTQDLLNDIETQLVEMNDRVEQASAAHDEAQHGVVAAQQETDLIRGQVESIQLEVDVAESAKRVVDDELAELRVEERKIKEHLRRTRDAQAKIETEIIEEELRLQEASGGAVSLRLERQRDCKLKAEQTQKALNDSKSRSANLSDQVKIEEQTYREMQQTLRLKDHELRSAEAYLVRLKESGPRQDYPPHMQRLLDAIRSDAGFASLPIGPIGKHLSIQKPIWASLLEKTLGSTLNTFVVTSKADRDRLNALMKRLSCVCPIGIQGDVRRFDVSNNEPPITFDTIARVLLIDNDVVFNYLVINQRIEQVLLIENEDEAAELMTNQRVPNAKACYTKDQRDVDTGHNFTWGLNGGVSSSHVILSGAPSRIKINIDFQIRAQQDVVDRIREEKHTLDEHVLRQKAKRDAIDKDRQDSQMKVESLRLAAQASAEALEEANEELDRGTIQEGRLKALQESLDNTQKERQSHQQAFEVNVNAKDKQKESFQAAEITRRTVGTRLIEARMRLSRVQRKTENAEKRKLESLQFKNMIHTKLDNIRAESSRLSSEKVSKETTIQDYIRQASALYPRCNVPDGETIASLDQKLLKLVREVEYHQAQAGGDHAKLSRDHLEAKKALDAFNRAFESERDLLGLLKRTLTQRKERWQMFRKHIAARAKTKFMYLLSERAFRGKLLVDHNRRKMDLRVQPNETDAQSEARQTQTLSGGEKSFSTICLLLALWEAIGAPIRCLDEFDVFMDSANREISMKLLISAARHAHERQFIFITPQSMGTIDRSHDVKIIKMRDPERGQTAIRFTT